jgi:beta-lactamase superfamily II metal-dependent hydrolase
MENIFVEFLPPWVETGCQPAFYDKESGTVLQQTARMYARVNMLIRMFNKLSKQTKEEVERFEGVVNGTVEDYIEKFNDLHDYVMDYFDNLDVQEEINNKLDKMVEDGTFDDLLEKYFNMYVEVIFPLYGKDGEDTLGDCSIIKTANKVIMIDTFIDDQTCWNSIVECLNENNINKIDYFLVTHYDGDHYGNYQRLIYSGLINNARIILPRVLTEGGFNKTGSDIKNALELAGLTWETADNETIDIDDNVTMRLFNTSEADYQYYIDAGVTNYNNFSICAEIDIYDKKILFTGDMMNTAMDYVAKNYITDNNYELVKDCHHGYASASVDFTNKVSPKYVLVPCSAGMISKNLGHRTPQLNMWSSITPYIYPQGTQLEPTKFKIGVHDTIIESNSVAISDIGSWGWVDYTINTNSSSCRTGSPNYPFTNLNEASCLITKKQKNDIKLTLETDLTDTNDTNFRNFKNLQVNFNNHTIANEVKFSDCQTLILKNINLSTTKITIENCDSVYIQGFTSSNAVDGQITINKSNVLFSSTITSTNAISCIKATFSNIQFNATSISYAQSGTGRFFNGWCNTINFDGTGLNTAKTLKFAEEFMSTSNVKNNIIGSLEELTTLASVDTPDTSVTLKENINNYSRFKVVCQDKDNFKQVIEGVRSGGNNNIAFKSCIPTNANDEVYCYYGTINVHGTTADVNRQIMVSVKETGNTIYTSGTYLKIIKVIGIA